MSLDFPELKNEKQIDVIKTYSTIDTVYAFENSAIHREMRFLSRNSVKMDQKFNILYLEDFPSPTSDHPEANAEDRLSEIMRKITLNHLHQDERTKFRKLIEKYPNVWHLPGDPATTARVDPIQIVLTDESPIQVPHYRLPQKYHEFAEKEIARWEREGIVAPADQDTYFRFPLVGRFK